MWRYSGLRFVHQISHTLKNEVVPDKYGLAPLQDAYKTFADNVLTSCKALSNSEGLGEFHSWYDGLSDRAPHRHEAHLLPPVCMSDAYTDIKGINQLSCASVYCG